VIGEIAISDDAASGIVMNGDARRSSSPDVTMLSAIVGVGDGSSAFHT
jgi:hypothetical protein